MRGGEGCGGGRGRRCGTRLGGGQLGQGNGDSGRRSIRWGLGAMPYDERARRLTGLFVQLFFSRFLRVSVFILNSFTKTIF